MKERYEAIRDEESAEADRSERKGDLIGKS